MKIAIGGFFHESNTFNPIITGPEDFIVFEKEDIYANKNAYLIAKGIIDYFEDKEAYQLIPLIFAKAVPNGEIDKDFYMKLKKCFFDYLAENPVVDAFVLALHGSMRVKDIGSAETDLLLEIKKRYPHIPVFCALDMHATITQAMMTHADAYVAFKTAPHIDAWETGFKAAEMADYSLSNQVKLSTAYAKVKCLIAGEKSETDCEPMKSLINELKRLEKEPEVISASYCLGFPWADTEENGVTAVVVTKDNYSKANTLAMALADQFKQSQSMFSFSMPSLSPAEALKVALNDIVRPVFISDSGDNPTAGSTGDNTEFLRLLSCDLKDKTNGKKILVAGIYDPVAVSTCENKMNQEITLKIGGVYDQMYCQPVELTGSAIGIVKDFGLFRATLILFKTNEFDLIITSKHIGFTNAEMFKALCIDYLNKDLIIVKLGYLTEDFREIAQKSYMALSRGCTDEVLSRLSYSEIYDFV